MRKSGKDRLFAVTIERKSGTPPEVFLIRAEDQDAARRRGAWFARVQPERVVDVTAA